MDKRAPAPVPTLPPAGAHLHLVGVCGMGMAPLALALRAGGWRVTGEDKAWPDEVAGVLRAGGVERTATGELPAGTVLVIFSSAVSATHPTRAAATARGLGALRRGEALAALVRDRRLIAIVGSHGKTTTTAMLITALRAAGVSCDYLLGGLFGDGRTAPASWTGAPWVIAEIDESDGTIGGFTPEVTLCVNVDWDHCDLYRDPAAIEAAFAQLAARTRQAVFFNAACAWSKRVFAAEGEIENRSHAVYTPPGALAPALPSRGELIGSLLERGGPQGRGVSNVETRPANVFSFGPDGDYALTAANPAGPAKQTLQLAGRFPSAVAQLSAVGAFNASNGTGALAVAAWLGATKLENLLAAYPGVRRRQGMLPTRAGVTVLEDYAHHPTEIAALLEALRATNPRRLVAVFQPHRFTRTAQFKADFARVLAVADQVFLLDVYAASEAPVVGGTSADVLAALRARSDAPPVELLADASAAPPRLVAQTRDGDLLVFVGAGDIDAVARQTSALLCATSVRDTGTCLTSAETPLTTLARGPLSSRRELNSSPLERGGAERRGVSDAQYTHDAVARALRGRLSPETLVRSGEPLGPKTTIRVGGQAEIYAEPANTADLQTLLTAARDAGLPVLLLGRGSNLIIPDDGVRGLVIRLQHAHWRRLVAVGPGRYWAGAGLRLKELCGTACKLGESGFEFLEGIPGTVGGALRMNAGAMGGWMFEVVEQVHFIALDGTLHIRSRDELHVDYRRCQELESAIALGAVLRARGTADSATIRNRITEFQTHRHASQPREPSAGCIFKNPPGDSAGRIIDELGLKGLRIGDAEVSAMHANFIINRGQATGADVIALVRRVRDEVRTRKHIELEPEVLLCGRDWQEVLR